ncbi:hypothetical protein IWX48DRAFT_380742 [Phyllosticta citricarpa]
MSLWCRRRSFFLVSAVGCVAERCYSACVCVCWRAQRRKSMLTPRHQTFAARIAARHPRSRMLSFPSRLTVLSERIPRLESGWLKRTSSALEVGCGVYPALTTSRGKRMNMVGLVRVYSK